ncbi:MAG: hypothetical protein GDA48_02855 [Hormoscilla sp. GM102CHS1]|nr:hypothetical protein [Hormoscilla sp. GM102CHS1]
MMSNRALPPAKRRGTADRIEAVQKIFDQNLLQVKVFLSTFKEILKL